MEWIYIHGCWIIRSSFARRVFQYDRFLTSVSKNEVHQKVGQECHVKHPNFELNDAPCSRLGYSHQGNQDCMLDKIFDTIGAPNICFCRAAWIHIVFCLIFHPEKISTKSHHHSVQLKLTAWVHYIPHWSDHVGTVAKGIIEWFHM